MRKRTIRNFLEIWRVCRFAVERKKEPLLILFDAERGYQLQFESPKSQSLSLFTHGERKYDNVILLPPKAKGTSIPPHPHPPIPRNQF